MRAFQISLNRKKLCLSGIEGDGVLTAIVSWVAGHGGADLFLEAGSLVSATGEHLKWISHKPLRVGDQIQIKVVDAKSVDKPTKTYLIHPAETLKSKKRYVRLMAKKLGWTVRPKVSAK